VRQGCVNEGGGVYYVKGRICGYLYIDPTLSSHRTHVPPLHSGSLRHDLSDDTDKPSPELMNRDGEVIFDVI
jgi:hypothetical protein